MFNNNIGMSAGNGVLIKRLYLIPTKKSYQDVYRRSYTLNVDYNTLNSLENLFAHSGVGSNGSISDVAVAKNIPNIMSMSSGVNSQAGIAYGWGTQRLRYIMEVESDMNGTKLVSYLQGYSEYHDPSITGKIDPHMKFFINSITNVTVMRDPMTGAPLTRPLASFNVISDNQGNTRYDEIANEDTNLKLIRPNDIIDNLYNLEMYGSNDQTTTINYADRFSGNTNVSDRANNNPLKHFTKTVNSFITARALSDVGHDNHDILRTASNTVSESNILSTPFIATLYNLTGVPDTTTFTLDMLERVNPDISTRVYISDINTELAVVGNTILDTEHTEVLYGRNIETVIATTVAQSVSSMLIENLMSEMDFSMTNATGNIITVVSNARSFIDGIDLTGYVNKVRARLEHVLFPEISQNGMIMIEMFIHSDVLGDTAISIGLNGNPHTVYRFPTFADSLYNPMISDSANKDMMAEDFGTVMDSSYNVNQQIVY